MTRFLKIAASLLCLSAFLPAQDINFPTQRMDQLNSLTVTARGMDNSPLADARVEINAIGVRSLNITTTTNSLGMVEIANLPSGTYEVTVSKGVDQATDRVELLNADGQVSVKVRTTAASADVGNATSVSVAQMKIPGKARDAFRKAHEALDRQKFDEVEKQLAKALQIAPYFAEALTMRGLIQLDKGNETAARGDFDAAIKADGGYALAYFTMGALMNRAHEFDNAVRVLDRGLAVSPNSWQGYFEIAKAQIGRADYEAALRSLDRAFDFSRGKYAPIHLLKGHTLLALRQYEAAMVELEAFLKQAPRDVNAGAAEQMLSRTKAFVAQQ